MNLEAAREQQGLAGSQCWSVMPTAAHPPTPPSPALAKRGAKGPQKEVRPLAHHSATTAPAPAASETACVQKAVSRTVFWEPSTKVKKSSGGTAL